MLLAVEFAYPPCIERIEGSVGTTNFNWELREWRANSRRSTQERQESAAALARERLGVISVPGRGRLLAALHYFHVACRLSRQGVTAGEFLAEMAVNLAKVLEVLFHSRGDGRTRDAARVKLAALGFSEAEIEGDYLLCSAIILSGRHSSALNPLKDSDCFVRTSIVLFESKRPKGTYCPVDDTPFLGWFMPLDFGFHSCIQDGFKIEQVGWAVRGRDRQIFCGPQDAFCGDAHFC